MQFRNEIVLNGQFGPNALALNSAFARSLRSGIEIQGSYEPVNWLLFTNASRYVYRFQYHIFSHMPKLFLYQFH